LNRALDALVAFMTARREKNGAMEDEMLFGKALVIGALMSATTAGAAHADEYVRHDGYVVVDPGYRFDQRIEYREIRDRREAREWRERAERERREGRFWEAREFDRRARGCDERAERAERAERGRHFERERGEWR
jgi:hypothetical protein